MVAVRCLNHERIRSDLQQLILIGDARWNTAEGVAHVGIEKRVAPDGPSAGKIRHDLGPMSDLAGKGTIGFERIVAALRRISVSPMTYEFRTTLSLDARAGGERQQEESG